jgi:hypothetical protein
VHETRWGLILHDLEDKGGSFCKLIVVEMDHGKLAAGRQLGRPSTAVGTTPGGAPAPRTSSAAVVYVGAPPPCVRLARKAQV